jgi:hypothetical protein
MEGRHALSKSKSDPGTAPFCDLTPEGLEQRFDSRPSNVSARGSFEDVLKRLTLSSVHGIMISSGDIVGKLLSNKQLLLTPKK